MSQREQRFILFLSVFVALLLSVAAFKTGTSIVDTLEASPETQAIPIEPADLLSPPTY